MRLFGYDVRLVKNSTHRRQSVWDAVQVFRPRGDIYDFAKAELLDCSKMISDRLGNVEWHARIDYITTERIFSFLRDNRLQLVRRLFFDGYVIVDVADFTFSNPALRTYNTSEGLIQFRLEPTEILYTSETYEATGESDYSFARRKCRFLNTINSSDQNLIENYGAMGIVSPETDSSLNGASFSDDEIEDMQENYRKHYGITFGKWSLMFVPRPTRYSKIDLPISQLQLDVKRQYVLKSIYAAFGIPKELGIYFENTKYANRNEAELDMYSNTVTKWADSFQRLAERMYAMAVRLMQSEDVRLLDNEFWYDFVGVYALQEAQQRERESARTEYEFWKTVSAEQPAYRATAEKRMKDLIERL